MGGRVSCTFSLRIFVLSLLPEGGRPAYGLRGDGGVWGGGSPSKPFLGFLGWPVGAGARVGETLH